MKRIMTTLVTLILSLVGSVAFAAPTTFDKMVSHAEWRDVHRNMTMPQVYAQTGNHGTVVSKTTLELRSIVRVVKSYVPKDKVHVQEYRAVYWDWHVHRKHIVLK